MHQWNQHSQQTLFDQQGRRLYLLPCERLRFVEAAKHAESDVRCFCLALAFSGARISEMLELRVDRIDLARGVVVFRTLKQRRKASNGNTVAVYREVPMPPWLLSELSAYARHLNRVASDRLWPWSRTSAWRIVKDVMISADISDGPWAAPKGLRHGFAIWALTASVPLPLVQRWLGHARITTTLVYTQVVGEVERGFAEKMWNLDSAK